LSPELSKSFAIPRAKSSLEPSSSDLGFISFVGYSFFGFISAFALLVKSEIDYSDSSVSFAPSKISYSKPPIYKFIDSLSLFPLRA